MFASYFRAFESKEIVSSIHGCIDIAETYQERWGLYIRLAGWAFSENSTVQKIEAWVENASSSSPGPDNRAELLSYGRLRPDVKESYGAACPSSNVGFQGFLRLTKDQANSEIHTLCISISVRTGEMRVLKKPFSVTYSAPRTAISKELSAMTAPPPRLIAPNLFILGAAKCGTTSLHYALSQHPEIHLSKIKEPTFFCQNPIYTSNPVEYFHLFEFQPGKKYYGESSTSNFNTPEAAPILKQLFPDAKFLLILRNPVMRSHALYQHMFRNGEEVITSFEQALDEEDRRFHDGRFRDRSPGHFWNYMYVQSSRYDLQLERYLALFPRENFFVLTLGEWKSNPDFWLQEIYRFLDVDSAASVVVEAKNQAPRYEQMSAATHRFLTEKFVGVRERVESLVGRRLSHWDY